MTQKILVNRDGKMVGIFNENKGKLIVSSIPRRKYIWELWKMDSGKFVETERNCWRFWPWEDFQIGPIYRAHLLTLEEAAKFYFKNNGKDCPELELDIYHKDI